MLAAAQTQALELKAKLFRGFADPSRLAIVEALRSGPMTVTELVEATVLTQSNTSNHLSCLRERGLVFGQQEGCYVRCRLSDRCLASLLKEADALPADVARGIYQCTRYNGPREC
jgi:DNA-binding transcriptional ArsR family regulator